MNEKLVLKIGYDERKKETVLLKIIYKKRSVTF